MSNDYFLLGSGPSASRWPGPPNVKVACANASRLLVRRPDVYGIFELSAGQKLQGIARSLSRLGTTVYTRPGVKNVYSLDQAISVTNRFGPDDLHDLHQDVEWGESPVPDYGQCRSWISSGVLLLWLLADLHYADRIYVAGLDGYPSLPDASKDYASGLPNIGYEHLDVIDPVRRRHEMNKRMSEGIKRITTHPRYASTEFVWMEQPAHYQPSWNIRIADQSDLDRLYQGYKKD